VKQIDVLPDDILLGIFDFYVHVDTSHSFVGKTGVERWQSLVHVCRRWRGLVLGSPRRLNLQLYCTPKTPVRDTLDVWPALPLIVEGDMALSSGTDDIIAALGQSNRVCKVILGRLASWQLEEVLAAMHVPFPELTDLRLTSDGKTMPVIPNSFLDGSAPRRLRIFILLGIPFPGLPKLLLFATHLVHLRLYNIPHSGYFSPEAMLALLSVLSSLKASLKGLPLNSNLLNLALTAKLDVFLHQNVLSSPL
jgi:F-box-like